MNMGIDWFNSSAHYNDEDMQPKYKDGSQIYAG